MDPLAQKAAFAKLHPVSWLELALRWVRILYAFTKSDYKTVVFPVLYYALMATPEIRYYKIPSLILWIWTHLLQFTAANQMFSCEEDSHNKPYRPIPAGLITTTTTRLLRWILLPACLLLSWSCDVLYPGVSLAAAFMAYNEFGLGDYWYSKNVLNAIGLVSWNVGAASIACAGAAPQNEDAWIAPFISIALIASTIHIQDFRDVVGDELRGRETFPVLMPEFSRRASFLLLIGWSLGLSRFWNLDDTTTCVFVIFGSIIGLRVMYKRKEEEDKVSLRLYMIWLCVGQTLPFSHY
ncbi:UbiA prenyltransferase family-domain-containing protein [Mycena rebaudengoi]|nr:UbiA prenyltransferase family-domain-containing protein [Mycena rebaudengoi]